MLEAFSNQRLQEDMARPRIRVSEASAKSVGTPTHDYNDADGRSSLIRHCKTTKDHLVRYHSSSVHVCIQIWITLESSSTALRIADSASDRFHLYGVH
jgi:hypothetical protein